MPTSIDDDDPPYKRVSYIREQKLAAVNLALNEKITREDDSQHPLSKYSIAKKVGNYYNYVTEVDERHLRY